MPRISPVEEDQHPELQGLITEIRASRSGRLSPLYRTLLKSPAITAGWLQLLTAVRRHTRLAVAHKELVILRIAIVNQAPYEYDSHLPHAMAAGITERQIADLPYWDKSPAFSAVQRAVLRYADAMTTAVVVPDAVFSAVRAEFDEQELMELTAAIASYNMVSRFLVALEVGK